MAVPAGQDPGHRAADQADPRYIVAAQHACCGMLRYVEVCKLHEHGSATAREHGLAVAWISYGMD